MKMDDPVPSPRCFGEGQNDSLPPGGMLRGPPCLARVPHLISTSPAVFWVFFNSSHPSGSLPPLVPAPRHLSGHGDVDVMLVPGPDRLGCRAHRWDEPGQDWLQIRAAHCGRFSHNESHDPASRHSSSLPPPLLLSPVSCSAPLAFASPREFPSPRAPPPRGCCFFLR